MTKARIVGGKGTLALDDTGILRLEWKSRETLGADDAQAAIAAVRELCRAQSHPLLVNITDVSLTRGARIAFTAPSSASRIALLGSSPVDFVISLFFLRVQSPPCPTRYFTSVNDALTWLTAASPDTAAFQGRAAASGKVSHKSRRAYLSGGLGNDSFSADGEILDDFPEFDGGKAEDDEGLLSR